MSTGSDALSGQAETLQNSVSFFKVNGMHEQSRRPAAAARKKAFGQKASGVRPAPPARSKPGNAGGADIEIGSDSNGADHHDKDFTIYQ